MLQLQVIGNIGGNAELRNENGSEFVTFKVAHNDRYTTSDGVVRDTTTWVSCVLSGNGGNLLKYLTKGQQVWISGEASVRTYHSKTQHQLVAGLDIRVRQIQLLGSKPDAVPSVLFDSEGRQIQVIKYYHTQQMQDGELTDRTGSKYTVKKSWIYPTTPSEGEQPAEEQPTAENDNMPW